MGNRASEDAASGRRSTRTFVFTDIEGSTKLLETLRDRYAEVLARHGRLIGEAAGRWGGEVVDTQGDAFFLVFESLPAAVSFAADAQRALAGERWPRRSAVRVRMGVHVGQATRSAGSYIGLDVHLAARISNVAHGGQVLLSEAAVRSTPDQASGASVRRIGEQHLKGFDQPVVLYQLVVAGLPADFPPPRSVEEADQPPATGDPPYQGLAHFEEQDAGRFFGREKLVERLVARLERHPFLAIIGASGSGKSSVVRAGLIPALRARGAEPVALLTPTDLPHAALAAARAPDAGPEPIRVVVDTLNARPTLSEHLGPQGSLLVVDQAEELFSLTQSESERQAFIDTLLSAAANGHRVVLTLRADFYDRLAGYAELRDKVASHQEYLGRMSPDELRRAITGPAEAGGWHFAPGLVELIVHDVGSEPGALPLLSHALLETWQRRRGTTLTLRGYLESGGVSGAIARSADRLMNELEPHEQDIARAIFIRLTELGAETPDTRRRAELSELVGEQDTEAASEILNRLAERRLVVLGHDTAEVAHEALIREWPTLRRWLAADREALRLHRTLTDAATDWRRADHDPSLLFRGPRLAAVLDWTPAHEADLNQLEREFIEQSRLASEREAARQRQINRRLRLLLAGAAIFLVIAVGAGLFAARSAVIAHGRELFAASIAAVDRDPELAILLAIEAKSRGAEPDQETVAALHRAVQSARTIREFRLDPPAIPPVTVGVALSPDGDTLYAAVDSGSIQVFDVATGNRVRVLGSPRQDQLSGALGIAVAPGGERIAIVDEEGIAHVWEVETGREGQYRSRGEGADWPVFSPDGTQLVTMTMDRTANERIVTLFDLASGSETQHWRLDDVWAVSFDAAGNRLIATGCPCDPTQALQFLDIETGTANTLTIDGIEEKTPTAASLSPDGSLLATAGRDGTVDLWNAISTTDLGVGDHIHAFSGHVDQVGHLGFSQDGAMLATTSRDGTTRVWDIASGEALLVLRGQGGVPRSAAFSTDGSRIATGSSDLTVRVWDLSLPRGEVDDYLFQQPFDNLWAVDARGDLVAALGHRGWGGPGVVIDVSGAEQVELPDQVGLAIALTADGKEVLSQAGVEHREPLWPGDLALGPFNAYSATTGHVESALEGVCTYSVWEPGKPTSCGEPPVVPWDDQIFSVAVSDDGSRVATIGFARALATWDAEGRLASGPLSVHGLNALDALAVSPDGRLVALATFDRVAVLDSTSLGDTDGDNNMDTELATLAVSQASGLQFSPDGSRLVVSGDFTRTRLYDTNTWEYSELPVSSLTATFSPAGHLLATLGTDGIVRAWDASTNSQQHVIPMESTYLNGIRYSTAPRAFLQFIDDRRIATADPGGLRVFTLDPDELLDIGAARVTRVLTTAECEAYLHVDMCPTGGDQRDR